MRRDEMTRLMRCSFHLCPPPGQARRKEVKLRDPLPSGLAPAAATTGSYNGYYEDSSSLRLPAISVWARPGGINEPSRRHHGIAKQLIASSNPC